MSVLVTDAGLHMKQVRDSRKIDNCCNLKASACHDVKTFLHWMADTSNRRFISSEGFTLFKQASSLLVAVDIQVIKLLVHISLADNL